MALSRKLAPGPFLERPFASSSGKGASWKLYLLITGSDFIARRKSFSWTVINLAVLESDRVVATAASRGPEAFCKTYKLNKRASFSYSMYGHEGAMVMAQEHCRRLQFFYNLWKRQSSQQYVFTEEDLSYEETDQWKLFCSRLLAAGAARARASAVSRTAPKNP